MMIFSAVTALASSREFCSTAANRAEAARLPPSAKSAHPRPPMPRSRTLLTVRATSWTSDVTRDSRVEALTVCWK